MYINGRYTLKEGTTSTDLIPLFEACDVSYYVFGMEEASHLHVHYSIPGDPGTSKKHSSLRQKVDEIFKNVILIMKNNKYMKEAESLTATLKYAIKDGKWYAKNPPMDLDKLYKCSYKKNTKKDGEKTEFAKKLSELESSYFLDNITTPEFQEKCVQLKLEYNHNIGRVALKGYFDKMYLKKHPDKIMGYILDEIKPFNGVNEAYSNIRRNIREEIQYEHGERKSWTRY